MRPVLLAVLLSLTASAQAASTQTVTCLLHEPATGRVISPSAIIMSGFVCQSGRHEIYTYGNTTGGGPPSRNPLRVTLNVEFRDPGDAARMHVGKRVTLTGHFFDTVVRPQYDGVSHIPDRLKVTDARFGD